MTPALIAAAAILLAGLSAYAVLGGADFGGGVWDAIASGPRRRDQREAVAHALGPVWETNHVWLIFVIVTLFTCFPPAFAAFSIGLYVPLTIALAGIVLRGAAFAFRSHVYGAVGTSQVWGVVFGIASLLTPLAFGLAVGGLTTGDFAWHAPFAWVLGFFAVVLCAQIAAVFLTMETTGPLREDFRTRAIVATLVLAATGAVALGVARTCAPQAFAALTHPHALAAISPAMLLGLITLALLAGRRFAVARIAAVAEVVAVLGGWYAAQAPDLIPHHLSLTAAAAPDVTLVAFLWTAGVGALFLIPSLYLLFRVFKSTPPAEVASSGGS